MITHIFFDFDGVLTLDKSGSYTTCQYISKFIPHLTFEEVLERYKVYHQDLLIGKTTHEVIWDSFCESLGKKLPLRILNEAFEFTPLNNELLDFCRQLKKKYTLGIITDNSTERLNTISTQHHFDEVFDIITISGMVGSRKKKEDIFLHTLSLAQVKPEQCIFIDNSHDNLITPIQLGMKTIFYDHNEKNIELLKKQLQLLMEI